MTRNYSQWRAKKKKIRESFKT